MFARTLPPALVLVLAILAGASMDATIKWLAQTNHVLVVTLGRYVFGALFSLAIWVHAGRPVITAEMWRAHGLRGFVIAGCATTFFWALTVLPLAEAVTLSFIYPLVVPFVARLMLGEPVRLSSIVCAVAGFAGVVVAMQGAPDAAETPQHAMGVAAVLVSAALFSIAIVPAPALAFAPPPDWSTWPGFLLLGALAATFMYLMAQAYARAEAQLLAPIHYTELLWASIIGYVIFHETPRPQIFLGAALIIGASLFAAYDERRIAVKAKGAT